MLPTVADVNGNGAVTNADLQALINLLKSGGGSEAGQSATSQAPEPSTIALLALGGIGLFWYHSMFRKRADHWWSEPAVDL